MRSGITPHSTLRETFTELRAMAAAGDEAGSPNAVLTALPFAVIAIIGQLVVLWNPSPLDTDWLLVSSGLLFCALAGLALSGVRRLRPAPVVILVVYIAAVTALQLAEGSVSTGSGVLLVLPIVGAALYFGYLETGVVVVAVLASVLWVALARDVPESVLVRKLVLWAAVSVLVALPIHTLRAHLRASILEARARLHQARTLEGAARELAAAHGEQDLVARAAGLASSVVSSPGARPLAASYLPVSPSGALPGRTDPHEVRVEVRPDGQLHGALCVDTGGAVVERDGLVALAQLLELSLSNELAHRRLEGQAMQEERRRIARELHDGLAHELAFIASRARSNARRTGEAVDAELSRSAERALDEARRAITVLSAREPLQLSASIAQTAEDLAQRYGLRIDLDLARDVEVEPGPGEHLLRIVREAISNAARHGHPDRLRIRLWDDGVRHLVIEDDGEGFDPAKPGGGFGLTSMRERAAALGGELSLSSVPDQGTRVEVLVP